MKNALILVGLLFVATGLRAEPGNRDVARLIRQLGDRDFQNREQASRELAKIGKPLLAWLRHVSLHDPDAEVRKRAALLIDEIDCADPELAQARREREVFTLMSGLTSPSFDEREAATRQLSALDKTWVPFLQERTKYVQSADLALHLESIIQEINRR